MSPLYGDFSPWRKYLVSESTVAEICQWVLWIVPGNCKVNFLNFGHIPMFTVLVNNKEVKNNGLSCLFTIMFTYYS